MELVVKKLYPSTEICRGGTHTLPLASSTFASLHDRHTEPVLHQTGYCTEVSCSRELCCPIYYIPIREHSALTALTKSRKLRLPPLGKIWTSPLSMMLKTKARTVPMARLPSKELPVRLHTFRTPNPPRCVLYQ
jgi:hypothetical protein